MSVELAGITLTRLHRIAVLEEAAFVHHRVPGLEGDFLQDLGRQSVRLQIEGIFYGVAAKDDLDAIRALHLKREPVDFIADILGGAYAAKVLLTRLEVAEVADEPEQYSFSLIVSEYVEPPKAAGTMDAVNQNIALDAQAMLDVAALPDALSLGSLPDITNPFAPLQGSLDQVQGAAEGLQDAMSGLHTLLPRLKKTKPTGEHER